MYIVSSSSGEDIYLLPQTPILLWLLLIIHLYVNISITFKARYTKLLVLYSVQGNL